MSNNPLEGSQTGLGVARGNIVLDTSGITNARQKVVDESHRAGKALDEFADGADRGAKQTGQGLDQIAVKTERLTTLIRTMKTAGGLADKFGLPPEVGDTLKISATLVGFTDKVKKVGGAVEDAGEKFGKAGGLVGLLGKQGAALGEILPGVTASMGAVVAVAGVLVAGVIVLGVGLNNYLNTVKEGSDALLQASDGLEAYYGIIEKGTTETIDKQLKVIALQKQLAEEDLKIRQDALNRAFASEQQGFGGDAAARLKFALASLDPAMRSNAEEVAKLQSKIIELSGTEAAYDRAKGSATVAANDAAAAQELATQKMIVQSDAKIKLTTDEAGMALQSSTSIKARIEAIKTESDAVTEQRNALLASGNTSKEVTDKVTAYKEKLDGLGETETYLTTVALGLAKAREEEIAAIQKEQDAVNKDIADKVSRAKLLRSGSSEQVKGMIEDRRAEYDAIQEQLGYMDKQNKTHPGDMSDSDKKIYDDLIERASTLRLSLKDLTSNITPLVKAREDETAAIEFSKKQLADSLKLTQKYLDDKTAIEKERNDGILTIEKDTAQKINDVIGKAIQAADDALAKLGDDEKDALAKLNDDLGSEGRKAAFDDIQAQIKEQETERDLYVSHQRKIRQILDSFNSQTRDAMIDRNFLELFKLQEHKQDQLKTEDTANEQAQEDQRTRYSDERAAAVRQREFQRNERLLAYQKELDDLKDKYDKQMALLEAHKQREITALNGQMITEIINLNAKIINELNLKKSGYEAELKMAQQTRDQRIAYEAQVNNFLMNMINRTLSALGVVAPPISGDASSAGMGRIGTQNPQRFARGGVAGGGKWIEVNERGSSGREGFNGSRFPGHGFFKPDQTGTVNSDMGSGGLTLYQTNHIYEASNTQATEAAIRRSTIQVLKELVN